MAHLFSIIFVFVLWVVRGPNISNGQKTMCSLLIEFFFTCACCKRLGTPGWKERRTKSTGPWTERRGTSVSTTDGPGKGRLGPIHPSWKFLARKKIPPGIDQPGPGFWPGPVRGRIWSNWPGPGPDPGPFNFLN